MPAHKFSHTCTAILVTFLAALVAPNSGLALPLGFIDEPVAEFPGSYLTAVERLPTGQFVLGRQNGEVWLLGPDDPGAAQIVYTFPAAFLDLDRFKESGVVGIAVDPEFETTGRIYFNFTELRGEEVYLSICYLEGIADPEPTPGEIAHTTIFSTPDEFEFPPIHFGGGLVFGEDGRLYVGLGDDTGSSFPQNLNKPRGKIHRLTREGGIPPDNPVFCGQRSTLYAIGLRNPFRLINDPVHDRIYAHDVGEADFEEINLVQPGVDFGWPQTEGFEANSPAPRQDVICPDGEPIPYRDPLVAIQLRGPLVSGGGSICDGLFYQGPGFPEEYAGSEFVALWGGPGEGQIFRAERDEAGNYLSISTWHDSAEGPVDLVEHEGALYYTSNILAPDTTPPGSAELRRIRYDPLPQQIVDYLLGLVLDAPDVTADGVVDEADLLFRIAPRNEPANPVSD